MKIKLSYVLELLYIVFFCLNWLINDLNGADILYEKQWSRIITGDQATRLTREIGEKVHPQKISPESIQKILTSIGLSKLSPAKLDAWRSGIAKYGWAQQENEPEYEDYLATQLIIQQKAPGKVLVRQFGLLGQTLEAIFDLKGTRLNLQVIQIPEILDRTVFFTVKSPANFVLNQEHFQKHFFEGMLNLDYPGLEKVKKAYQAKKILLATHETAEYFRRKQHAIWTMKPPERIRNRDDAAEKVLRHEFEYKGKPIHFGDRIDWYNNPVDNSEWIWGLNRMGHWVTLLNGYLKTGNEAYAAEYNLEVIDWTVRNPAPAFRLTRTPAWRNLEAGIRIATTWPRTFFGFLASPSFQTQTVQLMLASLWSHAEHIKRFPSGMRFVNNWVIIGSNGLANVGMNFPEFQNAALWTSTGLKRLSEQLAKQVYPDGVQHELAPGYHIACLHSFQTAYENALKTKTPVPPQYASTLEKMFEYLMYVSTPSREVPPSNDTHRYSVTHWLEIGANQFNRDDMLFVATNGERGQQPQDVSHFFEWAGHAAMRSDWSDEAWQLFFDVGPCGVSHQHEDKLNIDISAYGRDFITDGGKGLYVPDKWRDYFLSTASHNTILIDGLGQNQIPDPTTHRSQKNLSSHWFSTEKLDYAYGIYEHGYGPERLPVSHSRLVLFKKQDYWLVLDYIQGESKHQFDLLYHFTPGEVAVDTKNLSVKTLFKDGKNLSLMATSTADLKLKVVQGQENPEQGWISDSKKARIAAPTAIYSGQAELPVLIATIIKPSSECHTSENSNLIKKIQFENLTNEQANLKIISDLGDDLWWINLKNRASLLIGNQKIAAKLNFIRKKNSSEIERIRR